MFRSAALCALLLVLLMGCGASRPSPDSDDHLACDLQRFVVSDVFGGLQAHQGAQAQRAETPKEFNVLALSAGGELGVYGAGFLRGWREAGAAAHPVPLSRVHVVTAVSAGALLATHLFIGDEPFLHEVLPQIGQDDLFGKRYFSLLWSNAFLDDAGKDRNQRETVLTSRVIDAVAKQPPGRFLYVGVTDLDSGRFLQIDMTRLSREIEPVALRDRCYRAVIGASTAIPVLMSPKFVDNMMLSDGAVRQHVFLPVAPPQTMRPDVQRRLLVIVHSELLSAEPTGCGAVQGQTCNGWLPIALRTANLSASQGLQDSLRAVEQLARQPVAGSPYPLFTTFYATASKAISVCAPVRASLCGHSNEASSRDFCVSYMQCLADQGRTEGRATAEATLPWKRFDELMAEPTSPQRPK